MTSTIALFILAFVFFIFGLLDLHDNDLKRMMLHYALGFIFMIMGFKSI